MPCLQAAGVTEESALYERHQAAAEAALATFRTGAMGEPELVQEFEERLRKGERQGCCCRASACMQAQSWSSRKVCNSSYSVMAQKVL